MSLMSMRNENQGCFPTSRPVGVADENSHSMLSDLENGFGRGKPALTSKEQQLPPPTSLRHLECEAFNCNGQSSYFVSEKKSGLHSKSPLMAVPSKSNYRLMSIGESSQKSRNFSGPRCVPNSSKLPKDNLEELDNGFNADSKFQSSSNEMETTRVFTAMDSLVGASEKRSKSSRKTQSSVISKKTDFDLVKSNQSSEISRGPSDLRLFSDFNSTIPRLDHVQHEIKLQSLHGLTDSEVKENYDDFHGVPTYANYNIEDKRASDLGLHSESSSETDIMVLHNFEEKTQFCGVNSSPTVKVIEPKLIEDIEEPNTSRTQSLSIETLHTHGVQVSPWGLDNALCGSFKPEREREREPDARWLKRLKFCSSNSYSVTAKGSNYGEEQSDGKISLSPERVFKDYMSSSQPTGIKIRDKKDEDLLLSGSWIKRWCKLEKKPDVEVVGELQSSKLSVTDIEKKHFPSIAAMALMSKAMNGFQPCDIQNKGAFTVWNSRGLI